MEHDKDQPLNKIRGFQHKCYLMCENTIPFHMYRSWSTGITICTLELDGPIITGYFNIVTETLDDDGVPSALQHLIFSGSEEHPTKTILNLWAKRCLGDNIDGYCLKDRTVFTMSAAGSDAFLSLMPKYLDHIFFPSLEGSAYRREIHHFDKSKNTGVLYCKQQKKEQTSSEIMKRKMLKALYPGKCGYKSVIEGTTKNLRESTNIEKIKQFHEKFYRPENLTVLIMGKIEHGKIFKALLPLEEELIKQKKPETFRRPWQTSIKQLKKSLNVDVEFPCSEDTYGEVYVAWRGPSVVTQMYEYRACQLLLMYITQLYIDVSIQKLIIEKISEMQKEKTWLISVKCDSFKYSVSTLHMWFTKVPISIINKIKSSLDIIISNLCKNGINIETMNNLIHQSILQRQRKLESNPHDIISQSVFDHMVYGNTDNAECESKDLEERLHTIRQLEKLKTESVEYFLELLKTYFLDVPMVVVKGKPNVDEYYKLREEKNYIDEHIAKLYVLVDTSSISNEYRKYIPLLLEVIRESIMKRTDLGDISTQIGYISPHSISLLFQMEVHNYEKGVQLYKQLVFDTELTADKLTILITQVTNSLKQTTRKDNCILHTLMIILLYNTDDFPFSFNIYQLYVLCSQIRDYLNTAGEKKVLEEIEYVRKTMTSPQNMFVYMAVNVDKLTKHVPDVYAPWNKFFSDFMTSKKTKPNVTSDWEFLKPFNDITENGYIQSSEYVQLSSFVQVCPCINDFHDPDLAALLVCLQYFSQMDGPLWKVMKAKEWSCDFIIFANPIKGLLNLQLSTATDIVAAYKKTKWIVESHITKAKWVQHLYDSAKSLAILKYVNEGKSMIDVIYTSFERYCRNLPPDYNSLMVRRISAVTMDDMSRVAASYVKSLFDPKSVKTAIICNKSEFAEIKKAFERMKYNLTEVNFNVL